MVDFSIKEEIVKKLGGSDGLLSGHVILRNVGSEAAEATKNLQGECANKRLVEILRSLWSLRMTWLMNFRTQVHQVHFELGHWAL